MIGEVTEPQIKNDTTQFRAAISNWLTINALLRDFELDRDDIESLIAMELAGNKRSKIVKRLRSAYITLVRKEMDELLGC